MRNWNDFSMKPIVKSLEAPESPEAHGRERLIQVSTVAEGRAYGDELLCNCWMTIQGQEENVSGFIAQP